MPIIATSTTEEATDKKVHFLTPFFGYIHKMKKTQLLMALSAAIVKYLVVKNVIICINLPGGDNPSLVWSDIFESLLDGSWISVRQLISESFSQSFPVIKYTFVKCQDNTELAAITTSVADIILAIIMIDKYCRAARRMWLGIRLVIRLLFSNNNKSCYRWYYKLWR